MPTADPIRGERLAPCRSRSGIHQPFPGLVDQLSKLPLQGRQVEPPFGPTAGIKLTQEPQPILPQSIQKGSGALGVEAGIVFASVCRGERCRCPRRRSRGIRVIRSGLRRWGTRGDHGKEGRKAKGIEACGRGTRTLSILHSVAGRWSDDLSPISRQPGDHRRRHSDRDRLHRLRHRQPQHQHRRGVSMASPSCWEVWRSSPPSCLPPSV
jgi:hypothetical protein